MEEESYSMTANEPAPAYRTNSYADVMMMLYTMPITPEVKKHVGQRLVQEVAGKNLSRTIARINHLATLRDDWDGEGAQHISRRVLDNLRQVLMISADKDWERWLIAPDVNATLTLQSKVSEGTISIGAEEFSYFAEKKWR